MDRPDEAEESYRQALSVLEQLTSEFPEVTSYADTLASNYNSLANLMANRGKLEPALQLYRQATSLRERLVNEYPKIPEYQVKLAGVYSNIADKLFEADKPAESLEWFRKAIEQLEPIYQSATGSNKSERYLEDCYEGRSKAFDKLERYAEGERDWEKVVSLNAPEDKIRLLTKRWKRLLRQGMVSEAIEHIAEFTRLPGEDADLWYEYACAYALAADRLPAKQVEYADRAMELLKQAVKFGYNNATRLRTDSDLKQLRERDDFKTLVSELESNSTKTKATTDRPPIPAPE